MHTPAADDEDGSGALGSLSFEELDEEVSGLQRIIAGKGDPQEFLDQIQATRDKYHGE